MADLPDIQNQIAPLMNSLRDILSNINSNIARFVQATERLITATQSIGRRASNAGQAAGIPHGQGQSSEVALLRAIYDQLRLQQSMNQKPQLASSYTGGGSVLNKELEKLIGKIDPSTLYKTVGDKILVSLGSTRNIVRSSVALGGRAISKVGKGFMEGVENFNKTGFPESSGGYGAAQSIVGNALDVAGSAVKGGINWALGGVGGGGAGGGRGGAGAGAEAGGAEAAEAVPEVGAVMAFVSACKEGALKMVDVVVELAKLPMTVQKLGESLLESQRVFSEVSGPMAEVFAKWDVFKIQQTSRMGDALAPSAGKLEESLERLMNELEPYLVAILALINDIVAIWIGWFTDLMQLLKKIAAYLFDIDVSDLKEEPPIADINKMLWTSNIQFEARRGRPFVFPF